MKIVRTLLLLAILAGGVRTWPFLWELAVVAALGGVYWIYFRVPPSAD